MATVALEAYLSTVSEVVNDPNTFFLWDGPDLLGDGLF